MKADRVVALTGAGISAESGVPTFRGADGLWRAEINIEETPHSATLDYTLLGKAGKIVPQLVEDWP